MFIANYDFVVTLHNMIFDKNFTFLNKFIRTFYLHKIFRFNYTIFNFNI